MKLFLQFFIFALTLTSLSAKASFRPVQLVNESSQASYENFIRLTNNKELIELLPRMVFYTPNEITTYFQIDEYNDDFTGFRLIPNYGEPNKFFPWANPGGITGEANATTFKFVIFPEPKGEKRENSEKIQWWKEVIPGPNGANAPRYGVHRWMYPVGTIFGEVLLVKNRQGAALPFEVRTRTKRAAILDGGWDMESYKPFPSEKDLLQRAQELAAEGAGWAGDKQVTQLIDYLKSERRLNVGERHDRYFVNRQAFGTRQALFDYLPPVPEKFVVALLTTTPFKPSTGVYWRDDAKYPAANPTTQAQFHIVPHSSDLPYMYVDNESCMTCHDTVLHHTREFAGTTPQGGDWYGYVRGSDAIFTFHFMSGQGNGDNFKKEFVNADLLFKEEPEQVAEKRVQRQAQRAQVVRNNNVNFNTGRRFRRR